MKIKKLITVIAAVIIAAVLCFSNLFAFAGYYYSGGDLSANPGRTRKYLDLKDYNYAWLDDVIIRDSSTSVIPLVIHPAADSPDRVNFDEFRTECADVLSLNNATENNLTNKITDMLRTVYYIMVAYGYIDNDFQAMRSFNENYGIKYPSADDNFTGLYSAITYMCLNKDLYTKILKSDISIPMGTGVEEAVVRFAANLTKLELPGNVKTMPAFANLYAKENVLEDTGYPISENPTKEETLYWVKVKTCEAAGYEVPSDVRFDKLSSDEIELVNNSYVASLFTVRYEIMYDTDEVGKAMRSDNPSDSMAKLTIEGLLNDRQISYDDSQPMNVLFDKAAKEGCFRLEEEFYSDVYNYDIYVPVNATEVWITGFALADQLPGGSLDYVLTYVNGVLKKNNSTNKVPLSDGDQTIFKFKSYYTEGEESQKAEYTFRVIKSADASSENLPVAVDIGSPLDDVSSALTGSIISSARKSASDLTTVPSTEKSPYTSSPLTTFSLNESTSRETTRNSLFDETYPTDENGEVATVKSVLNVDAEKETSGNPIQVLTAIVKENPVAVTAPVSVLALGAVAGFVFTKKRRENGED